MAEKMAEATTKDNVDNATLLETVRELQKDNELLRAELGRAIATKPIPPADARELGQKLLEKSRYQPAGHDHLYDMQMSFDNTFSGKMVDGKKQRIEFAHPWRFPSDFKPREAKPGDQLSGHELGDFIHEYNKATGSTLTDKNIRVTYVGKKELVAP